MYIVYKIWAKRAWRNKGLNGETGVFPYFFKIVCEVTSGSYLVDFPGKKSSLTIAIVPFFRITEVTYYFNKGVEKKKKKFPFTFCTEDARSSM